uniref:Uncharacterized protein n=1 Tax=Vespula pensylvanica TaxID=30213 RepID=A0A834P5D9_VESPE|nr:hypothetical protein H0235_005777 [Vespula pensylvanica]
MSRVFEGREGQTCERLVIRKAHQADRHRITQRIKTTPGLMEVTNIGASARITASVYGIVVKQCSASSYKTNFAGIMQAVSPVGTFIAENGEFIKGAQREIPTEEFRYCRDLSVNKPSRRLSEGTAVKVAPHTTFPILSSRMGSLVERGGRGEAVGYARALTVVKALGYRNGWDGEDGGEGG